MSTKKLVVWFLSACARENVCFRSEPSFWIRRDLLKFCVCTSTGLSPVQFALTALKLVNDLRQAFFCTFSPFSCYMTDFLRKRQSSKVCDAKKLNFMKSSEFSASSKFTITSRRSQCNIHRSSCPHLCCLYKLSGLPLSKSLAQLRTNYQYNQALSTNFHTLWIVSECGSREQTRELRPCLLFVGRWGLFPWNMLPSHIECVSCG